MGGRRHNALSLFAAYAHAYRQAAAQSLCRSDQIGLDTVMLIGKELSRSSDAGLNLIDDNEDVALRAEFRKRLDIALVEDIHAALALNDLYQHRAGFVGDGGSQGVKAVWLGVCKASGKREKEVVKNVLTRCREGGHCSAVEGVFQGDDLVSVRAVFVEAVFARCFDGALVSLRAAVAEADLGKTGQRAELFR